MAEIDFEQFGQAFRARLDALGYSRARAERQWPATDKAMLSRAANGKTLSAGNYLLLCEMAGLDPYAFIDRAPQRRVTRKTLLRQSDTPAVSREASAGEGCAP